MKVRKGLVERFSLNTNRELPLTDEEKALDFLSATFTEGEDNSDVAAGSSRCSNFLLEAHYKVIFASNTDA